MIERYTLTATHQQLAERFDADVPESWQPHYNAAPTQLLPVITVTAPQGVSVFYWGTSPAWAKNKIPGEKIINLRAEQLLEKPALRRTLKQQRCLIPADGFYGWKRAGKKTMIPYRFVMAQPELCSFAGLWEEYEDTDGIEFHTFSLITIAANEMVATVQDRMPVILDKASEKIWLDPAATEESLLALLQPYPTARMNLYPVSPRITDTTLNVPSLIQATPPADQHGNLTLFD